MKSNNTHVFIPDAFWPLIVITAVKHQLLWVGFQGNYSSKKNSSNILVSINATEHHITLLPWLVLIKKKRVGKWSESLWKPYHFFSGHVCIMGSRDIKEIQMSCGGRWGWRGEEVWEFRWGLIEWDGSLLFLHSVISSSLCQLSPLHRLLPLQGPSATGVFVWMFVWRVQGQSCYSSLTCEHLSVFYRIYSFQEAWWFAKWIHCMCRGGTLKAVQREPTLGLITFVKGWWAFETDSGGWFDGCCVERALVQ